jgi:hypothetical protein
MPACLPILLFALALLSSAPTARAAVYGADGRRDLIKVPQYRSLAKAVAVAVANNLIVANPDGTSHVDLVDTFGYGMCAGEPFLGQPSLGICTGFLVGDRYLMTAGHCALPNGIIDDEFHPFCESFSWYFDYNISAAGAPATDHIAPDRLYRCKRILRAENLEPDGTDFTLVELERPVASDIHPLVIADRPVRIGEEVFTIGHPFGLPAKFSGFSRVADVGSGSYFETYLDTESGNSGGPVFNARNEVVGILVSGHPVDLSTDGAHACERFNHCDDSGRNCAEDSKFTDLPTSTFVQKIAPVISYLPKSVL